MPPFFLLLDRSPGLTAPLDSRFTLYRHLQPFPLPRLLHELATIRSSSGKHLVIKYLGIDGPAQILPLGPPFQGLSETLRSK
jgi:hypothetical protein